MFRAQNRVGLGCVYLCLKPNLDLCAKDSAECQSGVSQPLFVFVFCFKPVQRLLFILTEPRRHLLTQKNQSVD